MTDVSEFKRGQKTLNLKSPADAKPTGLVLMIRSPKDDAVVKASQESFDLQNKRVREGLPMDFSERQEENHKVNALCITGVEYKDGATWKKDTPAFSRKLAEELVRVDWIWDQISAEFKDDAGFFRASQPTSQQP